MGGDSPRKKAGVGCHAPVQGIFPTQGSNPDLPHCRPILYHLSHQGNPPHSQISEEGTAQTLRSFPNDVSQRFPQCSLFAGIKQSSWSICFHFVDTVNLIIDLVFPLFSSETQSQIWGSPLAITQHLWHALCIFFALSHILFPFFSFFHPLFLHLLLFPSDKCSLNLFWQAISE